MIIQYLITFTDIETEYFESKISIIIYYGKAKCKMLLYLFE
jgi:hypothetical protein